MIQLKCPIQSKSHWSKVLLEQNLIGYSLIGTKSYWSKISLEQNLISTKSLMSNVQFVVSLAGAKSCIIKISYQQQTFCSNETYMV